MNWEHIIKDEFIYLNKSFTSPEEAVVFIGSIFEKNQYGTVEYTRAMLRTLALYKRVIVLDDGIAMPHARPEEGALHDGLIFIQLNSNLDFDNTDFEPVRFLIGLVSSGSENHIRLIQLIGNLIEYDIQHQNFNSSKELKEFVYNVIKLENL
ncbi:MAG: PTS sugar transporter subunit IIA [[Pasteurella] mairii]|uniref:Ascorbate-specific PTS system EIIA component n=1 Tax=[Pasteurella] mairii TaxID=757 RepID=A0A379B2J2_9PAST|nr:PTS sugar transporter subunit IIA [[Pasteurella] mairii]SUB32478.1 ascorbate-specific phosphotransferase enzyme IIA component [[Pasteurella] mairii]